ncbi:hypothetical protein FUA23_00600 [Neolewinella aurantiaca]|uniref:TonB-dependent receptor-like beta-barrel domain-containing protein n=1 Tax=Neolewinella aurantiaca TaxID=2602767 RepID=A0A5C7FK47_9BACT|nr:hypothetical protein [Neolewinella aurantiaca]TXF91718.1 hypothetical protein FUA23_00600 [Neolewinella aurantiaca]
MFSKYLLLCGLFLTATTTFFAQTDLDDNEVTVVSNFEARLSDANRVRVVGVKPAADTSRRQQQYYVVDRPIAIDYPAPVIRPRGVSRDKAEPGKNGYIGIGVGLPGALYGDLSYDLSTVDNAELGIYANHHSFNNNGKVENQKSSDTKFGVGGTYLFDQGFAVSGGADFTSQSRYYYGYNFPEIETDSTPSFTDDQVRQRFNIVDINANIFNGVRTAADFDYKAGVSLYLMDGDPAVRESNIDLNVQATKWISDKQPLDIKLRADFTTYKDTSNQKLNNIYLSPSYTTAIAGRYRLKIGVNLTSQDDDFDVFPDISLNAPIIDGLLSAFVGAEGSLQKNTLRSLSDYNPWVRPRLRVRTSEYTRFYGGVEGTFSGISYRAEASYKNLDNLATFQLDRTQAIPQFMVTYDDGSIFTLQASGTMEPMENLQVNASIAQRFYSLDNQEKAWHLPSFSLNGGAAYKLEKQNVTLGADLFIENGLPYQDAAGEAQTLSALVDLNLNGEYGFSENFSAWLRVNNLLGNNRERFVQYPTIGLNLLVGISAKF